MVGEDLVGPAYHEAGHVVVAATLGVSPLWARVGNQEDAPSRGRMSCEPTSPRFMVLVLVAGNTAAVLAGHACNHGADAARARELASDREISTAADQATRILRARWRAVAGVAAALLDAGPAGLTGAQLARLVS